MTSLRASWMASAGLGAGLASQLGDRVVDLGAQHPLHPGTNRLSRQQAVGRGVEAGPVGAAAKALQADARSRSGSRRRQPGRLARVLYLGERPAGRLLELFARWVHHLFSATYSAATNRARCKNAVMTGVRGWPASHSGSARRPVTSSTDPAGWLELARGLFGRELDLGDDEPLEIRLVDVNLELEVAVRRGRACACGAGAPRSAARAPRRHRARARPQPRRARGPSRASPSGRAASPLLRSRTSPSAPIAR